jgi:hypothetical protein
MGDAGNGTFLRLRGQPTEVVAIHQWYFYKSSIVGRTANDYFVADENTGVIKHFPSASLWKHYVNERGLMPQFWPRWHSDNWRVGDSLLPTLFIDWFILIPLLVLLGWLCFKAIRWARLHPSKPYTRVLIAGITLLAWLLWLDYFPQSL